jgi:DNA-binding GntR family transcriptional regulator
VSGLGRQAGHFASGDPALRRRIDVTRLFANRPGERLTPQEVSRHTVGGIERVRELLDELVATGWLRSGRDEDGHVAYWREEAS